MKKRFTLMLIAAFVAVVSFAQQGKWSGVSSRTLSTANNARTLTGKVAKHLDIKKKDIHRAEADYPIIYEAPEGEVKIYRRSGSCTIVSGQQAMKSEQSGTVEFVYADDGVYILDIICNEQNGTYVKGTLSDDGKTITVPLKQNIYYSSKYDASTFIVVGTLGETDFVYDPSITEVTYTIDGDNVKLNLPEGKILTCIWSDDNSWVGTSEWDTVLTPYVANTTLVTLPAGLTTTDMPLTGNYFASISDYSNDESTPVNATVKVAKDGNTFYIQGLVQVMPEAWVMGEYDEEANEVVVPVTYLGTASGSTVYAMGYSSNGPTPIYLSYDQSTGAMEVEGYLMASSSELENTLDAIYTALYIGVRPEPVVVPATLTTVTLPFSATYYDGNSEDLTSTVNLGIDGNDVYVQGLFPDLPEGWIKGSFNEDKTAVIFPYGQYVGAGQYGSVYAVGDEEVEDEDGDVTSNISDIVFEYDSKKNVYTLQNVIYASGKKDQINYYYLLANVVIGISSDVTWIAAEAGWSNSTEVTTFNIAEDITATADKANGTTTPKYYDNGEALRLYQGNTFTITSEKEMGKIVFTLTGSEKQMQLELADNSDGEYSANGTIGTWEGLASTVTFTVPAVSGNQCRIQKIDILYADYSNYTVELPEGLEAEEFYFTGTDTYSEEDVAFPVKVAFNNNDVYFQGLSQYLPEAWVKGTLADGKVTIANWGLGIIESYFGDVALAFSGAEFNYDAATSTFTSAEGYQSYDIEDGYAMDEYDNVSITKIYEKAATPAKPEITRFSFGNYPGVRMNIPMVDTEGNPMLTEKLSYQLFYKKGNEVSPLVFEASLYDALEEDMTVVPYNFTDDYDFYAGGSTVYLNQDREEISSWTAIGVQSTYIGGGEEHKSEIGWYEDVQDVVGIKTIADSKVVSVAYYDLMGRRATSTTPGIIIKQTRHSNGQVTRTKILR